MLHRPTRAAHPAAGHPRVLPPVESACLLQGPSGIALQLRGNDGAMTQVPLTLATLREIAALAGSALASAPPPGIAAWQALLEDRDAPGRHPG